MENKSAKLKSLIRNIPDFPKKGIVFRDITTLLKDKDGFREMIDCLAEEYRDRDVDLVASVDARGFVVGAGVAYQLGTGLVLLRKPGKLPWETFYCEYDLEYGSNKIEIHKDAIEKGQRVLVVDDLLATGGTAAATCELVRKLGGELVGAAFVVELTYLKGREKLKDCPVFSLIQYDSE
ncbi:adenine phosphoribosyltransferase [candidate division TA06 bacterium]|uniref:Adenine phosphoribosyltransferase n=1 Tax=candidate division TA06 bacterium TaxID=2250710 RepID=A0A523UVK9_UNCT6|nr:MAG: adenine phosphoribosyltransferase [candidate division TA06 bacterium]